LVTSTYFNNFNHYGEQKILDDLVRESIRIFGQNMIYIPRQVDTYDKLISEDDTSSYSTNYQIEMYIKSVDGFSGDGNFVAKFGFEIRDRVTFTISQIAFEEEIGRYENISRPNEGDLIYFPLNNKCFQIKYVDNKPFFYQFGKLQVFDVSCELFEYSHEIFNTGIPEIDELQKNYSLDTFEWDLTSISGNSIFSLSGESILSVGYQIENIDSDAGNDTIQYQSDLIIDKNEKNVFGYE